MKCFRLLGTAALGLMLFAGSASADYLSDQDKTISLTLAPSVVETDSSTGDATFALQESAHETLTDSTGQEVNHYYIWVEVNGEQVLAVDPLCGYDFK